MSRCVQTFDWYCIYVLYLRILSGCTAQFGNNWTLQDRIQTIVFYYVEIFILH